MRLAITCAFLLLVSALSGRVLAQEATDSFYGRRVVDVRFEIDGRIEPSDVLGRVVDVRVGEPLDRDKVRSSMDRLNALDKYENITPVVSTVAEGVAVIFRLVPRYPVNRVEVVPGDTGVSAGAIRDEVRQRFTGASAGTQTGVRLAAVEDAVRRFLNDSGYMTAEASARTEVEAEAGRATLVITPKAGPLALIATSSVRGESVIPASEVLQRVQARTGQPFRRRQIETRLTEIEDLLRARGYYEAQASLQFTQTATDRVDVVIGVDPGPRVELRIEPAGALPGSVEELIPIRRLRSADQDLLEDSKNSIERALRHQGYTRASAMFDRALAADGRSLVVTYRINRGARYFVDHVEMPAGAAIPTSTLATLVDIRSGETFDQEKVAIAQARLTEAYHRLGYYTAVPLLETQTLTERSTASMVLVALVVSVTEGPRASVSDVSIRFTGAHRLSDGDLLEAMRSRVSMPYVFDDTVVDEQRLVDLYRRRGFLSATVGLERQVSAAGTSVALVVSVAEGPQVIVGRITVLNNERVSEQQILEVAELVPGAPLGSGTLIAAQQRLLSTTSFRRVNVVQDRLSDEPEAHVLITVDEAPTITAGFGGGLEAQTRTRDTVNGQDDYLSLAPSGFFELGRSNLGGRNRSINFFSRFTLKPPSIPGDLLRDGRGFGFAEYRAAVTYRERRAFRTDTDILVGLSSEQGDRLTYDFLRRGANVEFLHRLLPRVNLSGRYDLNFTRLFAERISIEDQPLIDRLFPQVRLSVVGTGISWDGRNNPVAATRGTYLTADGEVASRRLGSEVGYVKTSFQASTFRPMDARATNVLAFRGQLGLARGFAREVRSIGDDGQPVVSIVRNLPISQRFFAGGSTTVRGFQVDRLGIYEPQCMPAGTICGVIDPTTGLSVGGNGVVVANAELRHVLKPRLAVVGFADTGNVFATASDIDLSRLRTALGFGVRYNSPLGPIRVDVGFKLNRLTINEKRERGWEYHLSIGEAF